MNQMSFISSFKEFKYQLDNKSIKIKNANFKKTIQSFDFHFIIKDENNELQLFLQNINKTNIIIVDYCLINDEQFLIICFEKKLLITEFNQEIVQMILSKNNEHTIYFVPGNQSNFYHQNQMNQNEEELFEFEINNLSENLVIDSKNDPLVNFFWDIIKKCFFAFLIRKGYNECKMKDRKNEYIENEGVKIKPKIFKREEFISLRPIGLTISSKVELCYHIKSEKLFAIKSFFADMDQLKCREIKNYKMINYPFFPNFYGLIEQENGNELVIEFIYGRSFDKINEKELDLKQKLIILFEILNTFVYLHQNDFIYRDFKPNNLFLDQNNDIVLIDFDRMIKKNEEYQQEYTIDFNSSFVDPKIILDKSPPSFENDIFSFGKFIYYIFNNDIDKYPEISKIAKQCTSTNLKERQTFLEICLFFNSKVLQNNKYFSEENYKKDLLPFFIVNSFLSAKNYNDMCGLSQFAIMLIKGKIIKQDINKGMRYLSFAAKCNDSASQFYLGLIYYNGIHIKKNINKAIHYFTLSSDQNNSFAQFCLGRIFIENIYVKRDVKKAIYYLTLASDQNNSLAQYFLGDLYYTGEYIPQDIDKSIYYFTLAANQSDKISQFNLGYIYYKGKYINRDINKAIYYLTLSADQNNHYAQFLLGKIFYKGKYINRDINKAVYYFSLVYNHQIGSLAELYLGMIYENEYSIQNINKAIYYYTIAANKNNKIAQLFLGKIFYENKLIKRDINKSIHYFTLSANQNNLESQYYLGHIFYQGLYVTRDINKSIYYFTLSANQNYQWSQNYLGYIYFKNEYIKRDINKSIYYLTKAANQNNSYAQINLGNIYYQGKYIQPDIKKSIQYFTLAAKQLRSIAYYCLGNIYYNGKYIPIDINKAIYYYTLSADCNYHYAQYYLAQIYFDGKYIKQDINKVIKYLFLAAENQNRMAQLLLGDIYFEGKYLKRNINKAIKLYKIVSSFNNQYAKNNIGVIYKIGFDEIKQNNNFAKIFFNEAIKQKNDLASMFNLANIYLDEGNENESIKLLIESIELLDSLLLLCFILLKKYQHINLQIIQNELKNLNYESNELEDKIFACCVFIQISYSLIDPTSIDDDYKVLREKNLIYVNYKIIFFQNNNDNNNENCLMKNINKLFYEGFYSD